ncbi:MAG: hypothetical protein QM760_16185 [Nibricoccus sp.]
MENRSTQTFDAEIDFTYVEVKTGLNAVRNLRAALLDLAYALQSHPNHQGMLVLAEYEFNQRSLGE